ncbi:hypothetical protein ACF1G0_11355 [Streptomyces sp. NPDC013953]|uniref:hypothetical protein n=1 Tax=Streptomyces sp. NPDC013953 TaxID=3364868 RepID=UPI0036F908A2
MRFSAAVRLDGLDQGADRIVLRAADQAGPAEGDGERGVADEPGELPPPLEDRTRAVMDAVLGGLRSGCGRLSGTARERARQAA